MKISRKTNLYLFILVCVLAILYILSLFVFNTGKEKRKPVKTALLNTKYKDSVNQFLLQQGDFFLLLQKNDDLWFVSNGQTTSPFIPADKNKVENFINDLSTVINMYQISDNLQPNNQYNLNNENTFTIKYDQTELNFGSYDFSQSWRYFMSGKNTKVYEINTDLDKYLSTSIQVWSDPYIISRAIIKLSATDIQRVTGTGREDCDLEKLLDLRHGGISVLPNEEEVDLNFILETGDTSVIQMKIYNTANESEKNVELNYKLGFSGKTYKYSVKISLWTYNKIKEIML